MISFKNITFCYTKNISLFKNLTFEIKKNNFCAILGRSGAGKSSILNLISGIELLNKNFGSTGEIHLRDTIVNNEKIIVSPEKRNIAMIFQTPSLFPHKNILDNIMFGMSKLPKSKKIDKQSKIHKILKQIKMEEYLNHYPHQLSVGQQQRIAFARAIISDSDIILLDEPFSGLDFESKFLLYNLLLEIKHTSEKTIVLVTHDFEEAAFFANQFLIINQKQICHYNSIEEIYFQPCSQYIASLFQFSNILSGIQKPENTIETIFGNFKINHKTQYNIAIKNNSINYVVRPENIVIDERGQSALIKEIKFFGSYYILMLKLEKLDQLLFMKVEKLNDEIQINKKIKIKLNLAENELIIF
jgi:iron(III) transport system ATP-binding protein